MKAKIKKDDYLTARGGYAHLYTLCCAGCGCRLGAYQKDGPGPLKRLYVDRCRANLKKSLPVYRSGKRWDCPKCARYLAFAALYKKERRASWYLLLGALVVQPGKRVDG